MNLLIVTLIVIALQCARDRRRARLRERNYVSRATLREVQGR